MKALYNKANSLDSLGRHEEAILYYDKVLEIDPSHADALFNKSVVLDNLGHKRDAAQSYRQFLALVPDLAEYTELIEQARQRIRKLEGE